MKNFFLFLGIAICSILNAQDFRAVDWGITLEEVKTAETAKKISEKNGVISYEVILNNTPATLHYIFAADTLVKSQYQFKKDHLNKNDYLKEYIEISKLLEGKYGNPIKEETKWTNGMYRGDDSNWGLAISIGHMYKTELWDTGKTKVIHELSGRNQNIYHIIDYIYISYESKQNQKNAVLDDF